MIKFGPFRRKYMTWRPNQLRELRPIGEFRELPLGSVLHCLDGFQMNGHVNYNPSLANPVIASLTGQKFLMYNCTGMETFSREYMPVVKSRMRLTAAGLISQFNQFRKDMRGRVLFYDDITSIPVRPGCQRMVNYNSIFRARVMGMAARRRPRLLNLVFAYVLNMLMKLPNEQHFVHIPLEALTFERQDFVRVFKKYDRIATRYPNISSYLFLAHLYSAMMKSISFPARGKIEDDEGAEAIEALSIDPADWDPDLTSEEFFTNIMDYMTANADMALEVMDLKDTENPYKQTMFEFIPPRHWENINFILTCGPNYVIYNLRDIKEMCGRGGAGVMRLIKHVNMLAAAGAPSQDAAKPDTVAQDEPEEVAEDIVDVDQNKANQPEFKVPMTYDEKRDAFDHDLAELDNIDKIIKENHKEGTKPLSTAQKEAIRTASQAYKKIKLNGKTFEQLLTEVQMDTDFGEPPEIPETKGNKSEPSKPSNTATRTFVQSTTAKLDETYLNKLFERDLAGILTSFNKTGMFIQDLQQQEVSDELNSRIDYIVKFQDMDHKTHRFKFSIPKVDKFGTFMDNGVRKTIDKQRVANPILKAKADRVSLNSNYNKLLVERNGNAANSFFQWFKKTLAKANDEGFETRITHGECKYPLKAFPFELTEIGSHWSKITFKDGILFFDIMKRADVMPPEDKKEAAKLEQECGVWFGYRGKNHFYLTVTGQVTVRDVGTGAEVFFGAFIDFVEWLTGYAVSTVVEYAEVTILSKVVPVIHMLGYKYGLTNMLKYCNVDHEIYDLHARVETRPSDIVIRFSDKKLIISRTPRVNALIFGGLSIYDFSNVMLEDMDARDVYFEMLTQKKISPNLIKGIDALFDLFIDPITRDVLREMKEPTDLRDLLIRSVAMLTTSEHKHPGSASNFRFRGIEQMSGIIYNELARAFAGFRNRSVGSANKFSISEYAIKQRIMHHQLVNNASVINPIEDIKQYSRISNAGDGGRSVDTFKIEDRQFTKDSIGVVSEATVDNGKTGFNAMLPFNPVITNARGMAITDIDPKKLEPENVLSLTSLVYPGATQDD